MKLRSASSVAPAFAMTAALLIPSGAAAVGTSQAEHSAPVARVKAAATGKLKVVVKGLPDNTNSNIDLLGPNKFRDRLDTARKETLSGLKPGRYTLRPQSVQDSAGVEFKPTKSKVTAGVKARKTITTTIRYSADQSDAPTVGTVFQVTSSRCTGAGSFADAVSRANANPGPDTVSFKAGLVVTYSSCPKPPNTQLEDWYGVTITDGLVILGNGAVVDGSLSWLNVNGLVNPKQLCPARAAGYTTTTLAPGFAQIGTPGADNTGIDVTIDGLTVRNVPTAAFVRRNASVTIQRSTLDQINDIYSSCSRPAVNAAEDGASVTIDKSVISNSWAAGQTRGTGATVFVGTGSLRVDRSILKDDAQGYAFWTAGSAKIVSTQVIRSGGLIAQADTMDFVNSTLDIETTDPGLGDRIAAEGSATINLTASSVATFTGTCRDQFLNADCTIPGMPLLARDPQSRINLRQSAVGVFLRDGQPVAGGAGRVTADPLSWIQPTGSQPAGTLQSLVPGVLTGSPGLPNVAAPGGSYYYPTMVIPQLGSASQPGVLIDAVPDADAGNILISPLDGKPITTDVFGSPRVDSNGRRDIGAVQLTQSPRLAVTGTSSQTVTLGWARPADPYSGAITGYRLYYREVGSNGKYSSVNVKDASSVTKAINGLTNGKTYQFYLVALNKVGEGSASNTVTGTPLGPIATPKPTAHPFHSGMQLTWPEPDGGGRTIDRYIVAYRPVGSTTWIAGPTVTQREATISGLVNGTTYEFGVVAIATDGTNSQQGTTTGTPVDLPGPPKVTATGGTGRADVSWSRPDTNGSPITGYLVEYRKKGTDSWTKWPFTGTGQSTTIAGLDNSTTYEFRVSAITDKGTGAPGTSEARTTDPSGLTVTGARASSKPVAVGKNSTVVKASAHKKAKVSVRSHCIVNGAKVKRHCSFTVSRKSAQSGKAISVSVLPRCNVGVRVKVIIRAQHGDRPATTWKRGWKVGGAKQVACTSGGNG